MKKTKRMLAMLLCVAMCVSLLSVSVLAEEGTIVNEQAGTIAASVEDDSTQDGSITREWDDSEYETETYPSIVSVSVSDVTLFEGNGQLITEQVWDEDQQDYIEREFFYYDDTTPATMTIVTADREFSGSFTEATESFDGYYGLESSSYSLLYQDYDHTIKFGENPWSLTFCGITVPYTITVVQNPIQSVTAVGIMLVESEGYVENYYTWDEETGDEICIGEYHSYDNVDPFSLTVTTVDTVFSGIPTDVAREFQEYYRVNPMAFAANQGYGHSLISGHNEWEYSFCGFHITYDIQVVDALVQSVTASDVSVPESRCVTRTELVWDSELDNEISVEYTYYTDFEPTSITVVTADKTFTGSPAVVVREFKDYYHKATLRYGPDEQTYYNQLLHGNNEWTYTFCDQSTTYNIELVEAPTSGSGTCGDNLTWNLADGVLIISGTGEMDHYGLIEIAVAEHAPWYDARASIRSIVVEDGVTALGTWAFYDCTSLTSVTIPEGITLLPLGCFCKCSMLSEIHFPSTLTKLGNECLWDTAITELTVPASVTDVYYHFYGSSFGTANAIRVDEDNTAFTSVNGVMFSKNLKTLVMFPSNQNTAYTIPAGTERIREHAFYGNRFIQEITIPASVTEIETWAFNKCEQLTEITLEGNMPSIAAEVFSDLTVVTVHYPSGNSTYTNQNMLDYGGSLTWAPISYEHSVRTGEAYSNTTGTSVTIDVSYFVDAADTDHTLSGEALVQLYLSPDEHFYETTAGKGKATHLFASVLSPTDEEETIPCAVYGLLPDTTYYYRAYLKDRNSIGNLAEEAFEADGGLKSFTTPSAAVPSIGLGETDSGPILGFAPEETGVYLLSFDGFGTVYVRNAAAEQLAECNGAASAFIAVGGEPVYICPTNANPPAVTVDDGKLLEQLTMNDSVTAQGHTAFCFQAPGDGTYVITGTGAQIGVLMIADLDQAEWVSYEGALAQLELSEGEWVFLIWDGPPVNPVVFTVTDTSVIDQINAVDSNGDPNGIMEQMQQIYQNNPDDLERLMSTNDESVISKIQSLEETAAGGSTVVTTKTAVNSLFTDVKVTGAGLNATNDGNPPELVVDEAKYEHTVPAEDQFKTMSFSLTLKNVDSTSELAFPIAVDLKLRDTDIDRHQLTVYHFHEDGSCNEEPVYVWTDSSGTGQEWYARIYLTGLSDFAMVYTEEETDPEVVASGTCGDDLTWTLTEDGMLTISGTGDMWDFDYDEPGWVEFSEDITFVVIESGVTSIGTDAFCFCDSLTGITIPETVTSIGMLAFQGCTALTNITFPDSLTSIKDGAFWGCTALTNITIPSGVTGLGITAFRECTSLASITFEGCAPAITNEYGSTGSEDEQVFYGVAATANYPADDPSWTEEVRQSFGGNITWVAITPASPSNITSSSVDFNGKLYLNTYIKLSDEVMADPDAYVSVTFNGETKDRLVTDLIQTYYDAQGRVKVRLEMFAAMLRDEMKLQVFNGAGEAQPLTYKETTDVTDGFVYTALEYLKGRQEQSTNPYMVELAKAAELYGTAVQVKFDYHTELLTAEDIAAMEAAAGAITIPASCAETLTGTLPVGITKRTKTVMFESDNALRQYFYIDGGNIKNYTFMLNGETVKAKKLEAGKYYVQQPNIASALLSTRYSFSVSDGTDTYTIESSALGYAYDRQENSSDPTMVNLSKLLYRYSQAADAYFA